MQSLEASSSPPARRSSRRKEGWARRLACTAIPISEAGDFVSDLVAVGVIVLHERPERAPPILHHRTTRNRIWLVVADSEETRCGGRDIAKEDSEARGGIRRNGMIVPRLRRGIRTRPTFAPWLALHHTLYARALSIPDVRGAEGDT